MLEGSGRPQFSGEQYAFQVQEMDQVQFTRLPQDEERNSCVAINPVGFQIRHPPPPHELCTYITPDSQLFHTIHMGASVVDIDRWKLVVDGLVKYPFNLTFAQLLRMPHKSITSFHECYGSPLVPPEKAKNLWRIGNVIWTGVPLRYLLELAQPLPEARYLWSDGLDSGSFAGVIADRYQKDLPLEKARNPEVLLAYEINGKPLTKERGGPVRLVVPGFFGTNSTKWLCRISLQKERSPGPFTTKFYNVIDPSDPTSQLLPVWKVSPNSMIVTPKPGEQVIGPNVTVKGFAWSWDGISRVAIDIDGGRPITLAAVSPRTDFGWQEFEAKLVLADGMYRIRATATSFEGLEQPWSGRRNRAHEIEIVVAKVMT